MLYFRTMDLPLVSVIVPTKNSSEFLEDCLISIHAQTYASIELIVVDNFSTDATQEIAKRYTRAVMTQGPERSQQRNSGVHIAQGSYVAIIDSDMVLAPAVIEECVIAAANPAVVGVIIPEESFGEGFWAQCKRFERSFYVGVDWMEAARFFSKEVYLTVGGYNPQLVSGEDWDLSQRIATHGAIGRISSFIRHNEGRISLIKTIKKKYYYAQHFKKYVAANTGSASLERQTGIISRYALFFSQPKKFIHHPLIGAGMLVMKTAEFFFGGLGYITAAII